MYKKSVNLNVCIVCIIDNVQGTPGVDNVNCNQLKICSRKTKKCIFVGSIGDKNLNFKNNK